MISKIYKLGLDDDDDALATLRTTVTNLIILCTAPFIISYFPIFYKLQQFNILIFNCFTLIALAIAFYLNHLGKKKLATKIVYTTSCFMVVTPIVVYGRGTELQSLAPILMIFVFIFFDKVYELILFSLLICLTLTASFIYVDLHGPLVAESPFKYDYYINFGFALFSCGLLSFTVMKTLKNYVTHRENAFKQLEEKNEVIKQQNVEMDLFTSVASHDLKTPARTITSFLGLIEKSGDIKNTNSQQYLQLAISGARQLNDLVDGLSTYKNIEHEYNPDNYGSSDEILSKVLTTMDITNKEDIEITKTKLPDLKIMSTQLYLIFQNLLENAIKYNKSAIKKIDIHSNISNENVTLTVSDNGIGIEEKYHTYIFEPFKKLHPSYKFEGTGLGLAICKKILESYKATIKVKSNQDIGTSIIITIPKKFLSN